MGSWHQKSLYKVVLNRTEPQFFPVSFQNSTFTKPFWPSNPEAFLKWQFPEFSGFYSHLRHPQWASRAIVCMQINGIFLREIKDGLECRAWSVPSSLGLPFCLSCLQQKQNVFVSQQRCVVKNKLEHSRVEHPAGFTSSSLFSPLPNAKAKGAHGMKPMLLQIHSEQGFFPQNYWYKNLLHLCSAPKVATFYCCMMSDCFMSWIQFL